MRNSCRSDGDGFSQTVTHEREDWYALGDLLSARPNIGNSPPSNALPPATSRFSNFLLIDGWQKGAGLRNSAYLQYTGVYLRSKFPGRYPYWYEIVLIRRQCWQMAHKASRLAVQADDFRYLDRQFFCTHRNRRSTKLRHERCDLDRALYRYSRTPELRADDHYVHCAGSASPRGEGTSMPAATMKRFEAARQSGARPGARAEESYRRAHRRGSQTQPPVQSRGGSCSPVPRWRRTTKLSKVIRDAKLKSAEPHYRKVAPTAARGNRPG